MAKRKAKSTVRSIQLKRRARKSKRKVSHVRSFNPSKTWNDFLDQDIPVRSLVKYSSITLAFVLVLLVVFMLGRISAEATDLSSGNEQSLQLSGQTKQVVKSDNDNYDISKEDIDEQERTDKESDKLNDSDLDIKNLSDKGDVKFNSDSVEYVYESVNVVDSEDVEEVIEETPKCKNKIAGFDYAYTKIGISVSNFQRESRGDNWASISSLKLTVTNNEPCTIVNPTRIKIKMNPVGKGSVWWDDDVYLPDTFRNMHPSKTVTEIIPIHVSYSDIYSEKDFRLAVFDDYDIHMGTYKEDLTFS